MNIESDMVIKLLTEQNEMLIIVIVFLGAILGAMVFRHLRR